VTRDDREWIRGFLGFQVSCSMAQGIPPPARAEDFLYCLRNALCQLECCLRDADRQALQEAYDEAGMSRAMQAAFWTRCHADATRLRRALRDPDLQRVLERWEERQVFTDRQGG
jgi:hypothetical protein